MPDIKNKLDSIAEDVNEIKISNEGQRITMQYQAASLERLVTSVEVHIARTSALETVVEQNKVAALQAIDNAVKPLHEHASFLKGALWAIGTIVTVALAILGIVYH